MSGKGRHHQGSGGQDAPPPATEDNPQIVTGWEHTPYAFHDDRYAYIGKDDTTGEPQWLDSGEPQWLDSGAKQANAEAAQQSGKK